MGGKFLNELFVHHLLLELCNAETVIRQQLAELVNHVLKEFARRGLEILFHFIQY